jgi:predicted secreted protein
MKIIEVNESDNGSIVILPMTAMLTVILKENPTTGYIWQEEGNSTPCLELTSSEFLTKASHGIGAGGIEVFYFRPLSPGKCELFLKLWRPWKGEKSVIKRFRIGVAVSWE